MARDVELPWGTMPTVVVELAKVLAAKAAAASSHAQKIKWPTEPGDIQDQLRLAIGDAHKITKAGADLRALLSAYAHKFHNPRPVISDLARAQDTSSQGFVRRYSAETVDAVNSLVSEVPDVNLILDAFPSVSMADLRELGGTLAAAVERLNDEGQHGRRRRPDRSADL